MTPRLRAMFVVIGVATAGGATWLLAALRPQFAPADTVDAGLLGISTAGRLRCNVRILDGCRQDAGVARRYSTAQIKARMIRDAGRGENPVIAFDLPNRWRECLRLVGTPAEACSIVEEGACTDATVCGANADPQLEQLQCACRPAAGVCTRLDGGVQRFGVTLAAGAWVGAGCVRKFCGPVLFGDDPDWPATCPGGP